MDKKTASSCGPLFRKEFLPKAEQPIGRKPVPAPSRCGHDQPIVFGRNRLTIFPRNNRPSIDPYIASHLAGVPPNVENLIHMPIGTQNEYDKQETKCASDVRRSNASLPLTPGEHPQTHPGGEMLEEDDSAEAIGARLRRVREILGLSQAEFAEKAGMTKQTLNGFETGRRELTRNAAKSLRKTYGLSFEFMYFGNKADLPHRIATEL
ncbi:helix-turn-helix transcriptional regulator [Thioclava sp. GXIMD2076]|uniref:helix-turn-helix transcriptional regulator n=1 Tax=Thioclava sp. GXIMD2076 TaxID=3131931 RepID=UPI0030CF335D